MNRKILYKRIHEERHIYHPDSRRGGCEVKYGPGDSQWKRHVEEYTKTTKRCSLKTRFNLTKNTILKEQENSFLATWSWYSTSLSLLEDGNCCSHLQQGTKGNYRPVSLTSVVCKLLESLMKDKISSHLMENNLIKDTEHGFMSE
jgi:hypothetical protein